MSDRLVALVDKLGTSPADLGMPRHFLQEVGIGLVQFRLVAQPRDSPRGCCPANTFRDPQHDLLPIIAESMTIMLCEFAGLVRRGAWRNCSGRCQSS